MKIVQSAWLVVSLCASGIAFPLQAQTVEARTSAQENTMIADAFGLLARGVTLTTPVCISILGTANGGELPSKELLAAISATRPVVSSSACPRTYASMVVVVDAQGRPVDAPPPPGHVDPLRLTFGRPQFDARDHAYIYARELQGMSGRDFLCTAGGTGGRGVRCQKISEWSS